LRFRRFVGGAIAMESAYLNATSVCVKFEINSHACFVAVESLLPLAMLGQLTAQDALIASRSSIHHRPAFHPNYISLQATFLWTVIIIAISASH